VGSDAAGGEGDTAPIGGIRASPIRESLDRPWRPGSGPVDAIVPKGVRGPGATGAEPGGTSE